MATTVFLLRHAAHDRVQTVLCGRMPGVTLGATGLAQADALGLRLRHENLDALYTSPLERCVETASVIGRHVSLPYMCMEDATEIDFGAWTGQDFTALAGQPAWMLWNAQRDQATAPGGEAMAAVRSRIVALLQALRLRHPGQRIALVSHGDVIKAAMGHYLGLPLQASARFDIAPASLSIAVLWEGGGKILQMNEVTHAATGGRQSGDTI
ncbi:MAG: histidine phosphatase family protein [Roseomonas sp.]|jgi:probable phosphoglycerate mutase|nr:histidine phosphatase family protein [Roseomonas sp.]